VSVKLSTVYQVAAGNMQDDDILGELILLVDDYKRKRQELESKMEEALNQYASCSA
jgi:vacuolar-type H+-ATPase subunit D/Vma8